jgi:hypothetical protein
MKSIYDTGVAVEIHSRLAMLAPDTPRHWGKMNAPQALGHCAIALEWAVGDRKPPRMFLGRVFGSLVRKAALGNDEPMRKNSPTTPDLVISDLRDFDVERRKVLALVDRFVAAGPAGCTTHPHPFFGKLTPQEWGVLTYKHLDHHLRQFGV